jgi:hypothetical protein
MRFMIRKKKNRSRIEVGGRKKGGKRVAGGPKVPGIDKKTIQKSAIKHVWRDGHGVEMPGSGSLKFRMTQVPLRIP